MSDVSAGHVQGGTASRPVSWLSRAGSMVLAVGLVGSPTRALAQTPGSDDAPPGSEARPDGESGEPADDEPPAEAASEERSEEGRGAAPESSPPDRGARSAPPPAPPPQPVEQVRDARWSVGVGFIREGEGPAGSHTETDAAKNISVPEIPDLDLTHSYVSFGAASVRLNPVNDGITDDASALRMFEPAMRIGAEFRGLASQLAPWFEIELVGGFREREQTEPFPTEAVMSVGALRPSGRFGIDYQPVPFIGLGPMVGYHVDLYTANIEHDRGADTDNGFVADHGLLYGLHAQIRTLERPGRLSVVYLEPSLTWRAGTVTGLYASLQAGLRPGNGEVEIFGFFDRRVASSGGFTFDPAMLAMSEPPEEPGVDAPTLSHAFAMSSPVDQRLGLALKLNSF